MRALESSILNSAFQHSLGRCAEVSAISPFLKPGTDAEVGEDLRMECVTFHKLLVPIPLGFDNAQTTALKDVIDQASAPDAGRDGKLMSLFC
eukprot:2108729-Lingulodinium_polyedra.AAC.1